MRRSVLPHGASGRGGRGWLLPGDEPDTHLLCWPTLQSLAADLVWLAVTAGVQAEDGARKVRRSIVYSTAGSLVHMLCCLLSPMHAAVVPLVAPAVAHLEGLSLTPLLLTSI